MSDTINTEELIKHMDSAVKDCTTTVTENTDTSYKANINVADKLTDVLGDEIDMVVETVDKEYSSVPITDLMKEGKNFYSYFIDEGSDKYVLNLDLTDPETVNMVVHDISGNKQLNYVLDFMDNSTPGNPSKALAISEVLGNISTITGTISDMYDIESSDDELRDKIYASGMNAEEQAIALKKADELKTDREMFLLLTTVITVATMGVTGPSALAFGLLFGAVTTSSSFFWDMRMANILGGGTGYSCKWSIDPSGYVYEAVTSNRLEGVTATAYWIDPEYIDENGKGDTSKSELWDASEYEQVNPLITDINGAYAWDVPEGLWQVKYEKDGYETQLSDWLPVPPPQTEVNIGLVSKAVPEVENAVLKSNLLTVTFDKYMKPDTLQNVSIGNHTYTMDYNKNETSTDGTVYARTYTFKLNEAVADGESVAVSISNAESYTGVKMTSYSENIVCSNSAEKFEYGIKIDNAVEDKASKTVSVDFTNLTEKFQSFDAICAVYDENGALLSIKILPVVALDTNSKTNKVFNFDKEWTTYKVFAWDSLNTMQPLAESAILEQ